jgi:hypothetical protein
METSNINSILTLVDAELVRSETRGTQPLKRQGKEDLDDVVAEPVTKKRKSNKPSIKSLHWNSIVGITEAIHS